MYVFVKKMATCQLAGCPFLPIPCWYKWYIQDSTMCPNDRQQIKSTSSCMTDWRLVRLLILQAKMFNTF
ncbi:MAG: hypothetical protein K0R55_1987 [Sporomusa sp.]|nr:hypothetical protein [Sporomusa sp.]